MRKFVFGIKNTPGDVRMLTDHEEEGGGRREEEERRRRMLEAEERN